jgi:hypothetical protein
MNKLTWIIVCLILILLSIYCLLFSTTIVFKVISIVIIVASIYILDMFCSQVNYPLVNILKTPPFTSSQNKKVPPPKIIFQTYYDKTKIPQKVYDNIKKFGDGYKHIIYDDEECLDFLKMHFTQEVIDKFKELSGAHKADLFRYCIVYIYGGIYLDIKTELIMPISEIFNLPKTYSVISIIKDTIYQGVIATWPKNPFFLRLIKYIVAKPAIIATLDYQIYTSDFYDQIKNETGQVKDGENGDFYLFREKCTGKQDCNDGLDRYGFCCNIYDGDKKIIKTRYSDFPWK